MSTHLSGLSGLEPRTARETDEAAGGPQVHSTPGAPASPQEQHNAFTPANFVCLACLVLPWLNPFAPGPSSSVMPWLASALFMAIAFAVRCSNLPSRGITLALAALAAWGVARTGIAFETLALVGACLVIGLAAGLAGTAASARSPAQLLAGSWVIAALASTVIGLCQYFGIAESFAPWFSVTSAGEAFGNLRQRNQFASLTAIGVAALLWYSPRRDRLSWILLMAFWLGAGNAASVSRTGLVALLGLASLVAIWPGRSRAQALTVFAALAGYAVAAFGLPVLLSISGAGEGITLWSRVAGSQTCSSRSVLWADVLHLIAQRPWVGWGWGELDYAHYVTLYPGPRFCDILDNAHNLPLHLAVELGVPAAVVVCGLAARALWRARPWRETDGDRQLGWAVLLVIVIHSSVEYPLWYGPFQIAFGLALGLLWPPASAGGGLRAWRMILPATLLTSVAFAAWDYWRVSQVYLAPEARATSYRADPLAPVRDDWLFRSQVQFADLTLSTLTAANASWTHDLALELLHYSPESRVIQKIVESGVMLHRDSEVAFHLRRWQAAFPDAYAEWAAENVSPPAR